MQTQEKVVWQDAQTQRITISKIIRFGNMHKPTSTYYARTCVRAQTTLFDRGGAGARACMGRRGARCRFWASTRFPRSGARRRWWTSRRSAHHFQDCRPEEDPQTCSQVVLDVATGQAALGTLRKICLYVCSYLLTYPIPSASADEKQSKKHQNKQGVADLGGVKSAWSPNSTGPFLSTCAESIRHVL